MTVFLIVVGILALIPALNTFVNLALIKTPVVPERPASVAILIPARNEAEVIEACVRAALASEKIDHEVIVLNDGSTDATRALVESLAQSDTRLRIVDAPPLPQGWKGKPHACHVLATLTDKPFLLFIDADVRLQPTGAARLVPPDGMDLLSGVPQQQLGSLAEMLFVPMINSLIYGYLPVAPMRWLPGSQAFLAACGQMLMVRTSAYRASGGHAAVARYMHDGLQLARLFRRSGFRTDLVDGTELATCRMYQTAAQVWSGFSKNATEGMARPLALPIWTILLLGGHVLPIVAILVALSTPGVPLTFVVCALALLIIARCCQALRCREPWLVVALHPLGVILTLIMQWSAFVQHLRGKKVEWRGRRYATEL
jgi:hypothetical protein